MAMVRFLGYGLLGLGLLIVTSYQLPVIKKHILFNQSTTTSLASVPETQIQYKVHDLSNSKVYTVLIPANSRFYVTVELSKNVDTLETFAKKYQALGVLNAGFFDPNNQKTTSYVIQAGKITADPKNNERLMNNSDLTPYKDKILNRSEWRRYQCGDKVQYAIASHQDSIPKGCQLMDAVGGGPQLLPYITAETEGFLDIATRRDVLGMNRPNARTAIGIMPDGGLILVMAAQKPAKPKASGLSLPELAAFLKTLGVERALNLDGGSSSALYYQNRTLYGIDEKGQPVKRPVKSVLVVK